MRRLRWLCGAMLCGLLVALAGPGTAQEKTDPPPKADTVPRGFRMLLVSDGRFDVKDDRNRVGKLHDPVTDYGLFPVIGVFARGIPADAKDPAVSVMKKQQELAAKHRVHRLGAFTAFLALTKDFAVDDDRDKKIAEIYTIAKAAEVPLVSVGLAEATIAKGDDAKETEIAPQVAAWSIAAEDYITIVVYYRFKIVKRWKFPVDKPPTDADMKELADTVEAIVVKLKK